MGTIFGITLSLGVIIIAILILRANNKELKPLEAQVSSLKADNLGQVLWRQGVLTLIKYINLAIYGPKWILSLYIALFTISLATMIPLGARLYETTTNLEGSLSDFWQGFVRGDPADIEGWKFDPLGALLPTANPYQVIGEGEEMVEPEPTTAAYEQKTPVPEAEGAYQQPTPIPTPVPDYSEFWDVVRMGPLTSTAALYDAPPGVVVLIEKYDYSGMRYSIWQYISGDAKGYTIHISEEMTLRILQVNRWKKVELDQRMGLPYK